VAIDQTSIVPDTRVLDVEGKEVGRVKEVRTSNFLIDRPFAPDVFIGYEHVLWVDVDQILLDLDAMQIDDESWRKRPPAKDPELPS
jgi:hypothetical protein